VTDTTATHAITVDPDGVTYRWFCARCPGQAVGNDETAIRESAADHQDEMHPAESLTLAGTTRALADAVADARRSQVGLARLRELIGHTGAGAIGDPTPTPRSQT